MSKVLIVDDSAFMRGILRDLLSERTGVEIHEADCKADAIKLFKKVQPDLVLLDVVMKENEFEGVEVLREIKTSHSHAKVIMLTSVGQADIIDECNKLGAESYIEKPFDRDHFLATLDKFLI